jgi:hypothetical protein
MDLHQARFLGDEFFGLTFMATVQRAKVYAGDVGDKEKSAFRRALRSQLDVLAKLYREGVSEETHVQNIGGLSDSISISHAHILRNDRFRIGLAQKALNLYLKYLWCADKITMPPHCPFDARVIAKLRGYHGPTWTALDNRIDYLALVEAAKTEAGNLSLAAWELQLFNIR